MHYVLSDIHNDNKSFCEMLRRIHFTDRDHLFILGDLFDRNQHDPDPLGVYFTVLSLGERCTIIRGNHDDWLASYILDYYRMPEQKRKKAEPYPYNSFELLTKRLPPVDMQRLAERIKAWPLQETAEVSGQKYLLAHELSEQKLQDGIEDHITVCGHRNIGGKHIWKNEKGNVDGCDCGCGFRDGRLGCLCLETEEMFYV